ncbi:MAG: DUF721 domain-containing protein [Zoogloeaceae bacterium]|jgi:hypothetical protein|nr:DUF721 domain-containing protein [Zoogloeaceae bacterium]
MPKSRDQIRSLEDCLAADTSLARLSAHARRLLAFQRTFESTTSLARQSRVANLRAGRIIIHATNSAVATKLRQLEPRLMIAFKKLSQDITGIDVRLQTGAETQAPNRPKVNKDIGVSQKQALTSLADGLPEKSSLSAALRRLVSRSK